MPIFGWGKKKEKEKDTTSSDRDTDSVKAATDEYRKAADAARDKPHSADGAAALIRARKKRQRAILEELDK